MGCGTSSEGEYTGLGVGENFIYQEPDAVQHVSILYPADSVADDVEAQEVRTLLTSHLLNDTGPEREAGLCELEAVIYEMGLLAVDLCVVGKFIDAEKTVKDITGQLVELGVVSTVLSPRYTISSRELSQISEDVLN